MCLIWLKTAQAQEPSFVEGNTLASSGRVEDVVCNKSEMPLAVKEALHWVCRRESSKADDVAVRSAIIIGFVGGFVSHDDPKRPEVQFAAYLRDRYPSAIHVEVFANRDGKKALNKVLGLTGRNGNDVPSAAKGEQEHIIIYGHSWGTSQALTLAQELGRHGVPVRLTIQVDSIVKVGQQDSRIPSNVASAIHFYQSSGLLRGR